MPTVSLHHGNCLDFLRTLPAGSIDAVITDPPYGIAYQHSGGGGGISRLRRPGAVTRQARKPIQGDDQPFDPTPFLSWRCLFWGANHYATRLPRGGSWLVWDKSCGKGPNDSFVDGDIAWCSVPGIKRNIFRYLWKGLACVKLGEDNGRRHHPAQKPLGLMRWCIEQFDFDSGATIFDPYMGSGTTGVAAVQLGFNFIGVEIDPTYFEIARHRIAAARAGTTEAVA